MIFMKIICSQEDSRPLLWRLILMGWRRNSELSVNVLSENFDVYHFPLYQSHEDYCKSKSLQLIN